MPTVTPIQGPIYLKNGSVPVVPLFSYPKSNNGSFLQIPVSTSPSQARACFCYFFLLFLSSNTITGISSISIVWVDRSSLLICGNNFDDLLCVVRVFLFLMLLLLFLLYFFFFGCLTKVVRVRFVKRCDDDHTQILRD